MAYVSDKCKTNEKTANHRTVRSEIKNFFPLIDSNKTQFP